MYERRVGVDPRPRATLGASGYNPVIDVRAVGLRPVVTHALGPEATPTSHPTYGGTLLPHLPPPAYHNLLPTLAQSPPGMISCTPGAGPILTSITRFRELEPSNLVSIIGSKIRGWEIFRIRRHN